MKSVFIYGISGDIGTRVARILSTAGYEVSGLINSSAPWTIIRPGRLVDTEPTGQVQAALALPYGEISREELANFISDVIRTDIYRKQIIEVISK